MTENPSSEASAVVVWHISILLKRAEPSETLTCGDASLVGVKPEIERMCVSSKLYSSLAAGNPILAVVGEGDEVARVVRENNCGVYVEPGDSKAATEILKELVDDPN